MADGGVLFSLIISFYLNYLQESLFLNIWIYNTDWIYNFVSFREVFSTLPVDSIGLYTTMHWYSVYL